MTRYEAMNTLEDYRDYILPEDIEALNMAIDALSVDLVRCGECIYRDCCSELGDEIDADDYCSFGKREK